MAVKLADVPGLALRPKRPSLMLWLCLFLVAMLLGFVVDFFLLYYWGRESSLWEVLGASFLIWMSLLSVRGMTYMNQVRLADGWDEARAEDLKLRYQKGRRSLQVLEARVCTAVSPKGTVNEHHMAGLMSGETVVRAQPFRLNGVSVRHSRLGGDEDVDSESVLIEALTVVLSDLGLALSKMPGDLVLNFVLESNSELAEGTLRRIWQHVWKQSGIRQSLVAVEGSGFGAVDQWLDQELFQDAFFLVVAFQFVPDQPSGSAEVVTGLLLGGSKIPTYCNSIALIHRPELIRNLENAASDRVLQALGWVPVEAVSIEHVWRAGIDAQLRSSVIMMLADALAPDDFDKKMHDLDLLLGHAGNASPWLAVSVIAQTIQAGSGAQLVLNGDFLSKSNIWVCVVAPALPLSC